MKSIKIYSLFLCSALLGMTAFAQTTTESFKVAGNCGMCESRIEKAAKAAGATEADWNAETKMLKVSFGSGTTVAKIQQKIAEVGHDNDAFKATNEVYNKLPGCCKYERSAAPAAEKMDCCKDGKCKDEGKCDKPCCKKENMKEGDAAKAGCSMDNKEGGSCCKKEGHKEGEHAKAGCTKDGKAGASCCKKD
jgi:hypothetical protein